MTTILYSIEIVVTTLFLKEINKLLKIYNSIKILTITTQFRRFPVRISS